MKKFKLPKRWYVICETEKELDIAYSYLDAGCIREFRVSILTIGYYFDINGLGVMNSIDVIESLETLTFKQITFADFEKHVVGKDMLRKLMPLKESSLKFWYAPLLKNEEAEDVLEYKAEMVAARETAPRFGYTMEYNTHKDSNLKEVVIVASHPHIAIERLGDKLGEKILNEVRITDIFEITI